MVILAGGWSWGDILADEPTGDIFRWGLDRPRRARRGCSLARSPQDAHSGPGWRQVGRPWTWPEPAQRNQGDTPGRL